MFFIDGFPNLCGGLRLLGPLLDGGLEVGVHHVEGHHAVPLNSKHQNFARAYYDIVISTPCREHVKKRLAFLADASAFVPYVEDLLRPPPPKHCSI